MRGTCDWHVQMAFDRCCNWSIYHANGLIYQNDMFPNCCLASIRPRNNNVKCHVSAGLWQIHSKCVSQPLQITLHFSISAINSAPGINPTTLPHVYWSLLQGILKMRNVLGHCWETQTSWGDSWNGKFSRSLHIQQILCEPLKSHEERLSALQSECPMPALEIAKQL